MSLQVDLSITPPTITSGQTAVLAWLSSGATTLSIDHGIGTVSGPTSSVLVSPGAENTTYTITASDGLGNTKTSSIILHVVPAISFQALPSNGPCGNYNLVWSVVGGDAQSIDQGIGSVSGSGSTAVTVNSGSVTYTLTVVKGVTSYHATATIAMARYTGGTSSSPSITVAVDGSTTNWGSNVSTGLYKVEYVQGAWMWKPLPNYSNVNAPSGFCSNSSDPDSSGQPVPAWNTTAANGDNRSGSGHGWAYDTTLLNAAGSRPGFDGPTFYNWAAYDLGTVWKVGRLIVSYAGYIITGGFIYSSIDGVHWTQNTEITLPSPPGEQQTRTVDHTFTTPICCQYIAVRINDDGGGSPANCVWNFLVYDDQGTQMYAAHATAPQAPTNENCNQPWTVGPITITNGTTESVDMGITGQAPYYSSESAAQSATSGSTQWYCHALGPLGAKVADVAGNYADNVQGSPALQLRLVGPSTIVSLSASPTSITAGDTPTLSWTSNATTTTIDHGVGTVVGASGTVGVDPTSTTTYTITGTTDGFSAATASATLTVSPPLPPSQVSAIGSCSGSVVLTWNVPTSSYTSFRIMRASPDPILGGVLTQIGTTSGTSYADSTATHWQTAWYAVVTDNNGQTSANSNIVFTAPLGVPTTPTGLTIQSLPGALQLSWPSVNNAASYNLYRCLSPGAETLYQAGLLYPSIYDPVGEIQQPYYYKISAVNSCGESALSSEVSTTPAQYSCSTRFNETSPSQSVYQGERAPSTAYNIKGIPTTSYTASPSPTNPWT